MKRRTGAAAAIAAAALVFLLSGCGKVSEPEPAVQTVSAEPAVQTVSAEQDIQTAVGLPPETPPEWVLWKEKTEEADLDGDGIAETLTLADRKFTARRGETLLFAAEEGWQTADLLHADIDRDGQEEVLLLVWKQGSYGDHRPFWVEENDTALSEHIFIYDCDPDRLRPIWMSSALDTPVREWTADQDGRLLLVTPEGTERAAAWEGWGLKYLDGREEETRAAKETRAVMEMQAAQEAQAAQETQTVTLLAVGDNIAHSSVIEAARIPGTWDFDFSPIYDRVRERISSYDISAVNQETILVKSPGDRSGFPRFGTPEAMGDALAGAGFDVVLGAANHAMDKGPDKIRSTVAWWREHHPEVTLLGLHDTQEDQKKIRVIEKNGIRIAMLNYTYGLNGMGLPADALYLADLLPGEEAPDRASSAGEAASAGPGSSEDPFTEQIRQAEDAADLTICFLHIGTEYASEPSEAQMETVRRAVDAGADAVICSHPHVVQRCERIRTPAGHTAVVFWSLGNFMSNQMDPDAILGGAAELKIVREAPGSETDPASEEDSLVMAEGGSGQNARIEAFRMLPTVCHFGNGITRVYFLEDYTEELAAEHALSRTAETPVTVQGLWEQWKRRTALW